MTAPKSTSICDKQGLNLEPMNRNENWLGLSIYPNKVSMRNFEEMDTLSPFRALTLTQNLYPRPLVEFGDNFA